MLGGEVSEQDISDRFLNRLTQRGGDLMPTDNRTVSYWKIFSTIAMLFASLMSLFSCGKESKPIRIGAALVLSGPAAFVGEEVRDGLLLAVNEINEKGGINGHPIELIVEDASKVPEGVETGEEKEEGGSPSRIDDRDPAKLAFERLRQKEPLVIVSCLSYLSMKLAPLAEAEKQLMISLVATVPELTEEKNWVYRYWPTAEHEAPPMMDLFQKIEQKGGSLGVIYLDDAYGGSVFSHLKSRCTLFGTSIYAAPFPISQKNFQNQVKRVESTSAIAIVGFDGHIIGALKALRQLGYNGEIISTTTATLPSVTKIPESQGIHVTAPAIYNPNYHFADDVQQKYFLTYNKPFTQYSANGYDAIYVLAGLLEDQPLSSESLKALLDKGFVYSGVFGNISLEKGKKDIVFPIFPAQIQNGKIIYR